jgi:low temperature requirement protein LtrA
MTSAASSSPASPARRWTLFGRDTEEPHRVSTPLELLFDLTFVVAIAAAASQLHHAVGDHHLGQGLHRFAAVFFAIWWAWMNFTWFASAYDNDDPVYRLLTMLQMVGVLILAAGVPAMAEGHLATVTAGYAVMRIPLMVQWWRASRDHPQCRHACRRYAIGIGLVQLLWLLRLLLPTEYGWYAFYLLVVAELAVPVWAEMSEPTPWHAHHIAERYGLFTIIVLGECVLGATNAIGNVIATTGWSLDTALVGLGSAGLVLSLWWSYFLMPSAETLHRHRNRSFGWGYGHFAIFASLAALGAFLEVAADALKTGPAAGGADHGAVTPLLAISLIAAAVAVYLVTIWVIGIWLERDFARLWWPLAGGFGWLALVVAAVALGLPLPWAMVALVGTPALAIWIFERGRQADHHAH